MAANPSPPTIINARAAGATSPSRRMVRDATTPPIPNTTIANGGQPAEHRNRDDRDDERRDAREQMGPRLPGALLVDLAHPLIIHDRRAATAVSGWSANTPSTPASKNADELARRVEARRAEPLLVAERPAVHGEAAGVRVGHETRRGGEAARGVAGDDEVLVRADGLRVLGDVGQRHVGARLDELPDRHTQSRGAAPAGSRTTRRPPARPACSDPAASSDASSGGPNGRPSCANRAGCLSSR